MKIVDPRRLEIENDILVTLRVAAERALEFRPQAKAVDFGFLGMIETLEHHAVGADDREDRFFAARRALGNEPDLIVPATTAVSSFSRACANSCARVIASKLCRSLSWRSAICACAEPTVARCLARVRSTQWPRHRDVALRSIGPLSLHFGPAWRRVRRADHEHPPAISPGPTSPQPRHPAHSATDWRWRRSRRPAKRAIAAAEHPGPVTGTQIAGGPHVEREEHHHGNEHRHRRGKDVLESKRMGSRSRTFPRWNLDCIPGNHPRPRARGNSRCKRREIPLHDSAKTKAAAERSRHNERDERCLELGGETCGDCLQAFANRRKIAIGMERDAQGRDGRA